MGSLLPDRSSGVYWHLLLPTELGGLGLWLEEDFPDLIKNLPMPSKMVVKDIVEGRFSDSDYTALKGFTTNSSYRGYKLLETETSLIQEYFINELIPIMNSMSYNEALKMYNLDPSYSFRQNTSRLRGKMVMTEEDIKDIVLRPFLFKEILSREAKVKVFNTVPFKKRYQNLWDLIYRGDCTISESDLKTAFKFKKKAFFYDISFGTGRNDPDSLFNELTKGLPNLRLPKDLVGILTSPVNFEPDFSLGEYV